MPIVSVPSPSSITVLTATYNRAHLLSDLYQSLCWQTCHQFDWIIVDDGSTDGTEALVQNWIQQTLPFRIIYIKKENGGKNRAINDGVKRVKTPFTMIIDSDDYLTEDAIAFLSVKALLILQDERMAGIAGLRGHDTTTPLAKVDFKDNDSLVCNNLERFQYGLKNDACEVYKTSVLRNHPFSVWEGEKFSPEEIVWDTIALEGLSLRWYNKVTLIVRYQKDGMTNDSNTLMKSNPMGYAMLYKHRVKLSDSFNNKFYWNCQLIANSILGHNFGFSLQSNLTLCSILALPVGIALSIKRLLQRTIC